MWEPRCPSTLWASTACYRASFTFTLLIYNTKTWTLQRETKVKIDEMDTKFLRSTEKRKRRDRIKNEIISTETGLQNLIAIGDYNGLVGHIK
jgi:hypothetical protein